MQKEEIGNMVREILKKQGLLNRPVEKAVSSRRQPVRTSPVVFSVFHAGIRKLEQALEQVKLIESIASRSSTYTMNSARSWVCGKDVREKTGSRCILDTVKPEGLEKVLQKADILVLPTFCFKTAAKTARLIGDDQESAIVLSALFQEKPVLATNDGFTLLDTLSNKRIQNEVKRVLDNLESYGMVFCQTEQLAAAFQRMVSGGHQRIASEATTEMSKRTTTGRTLITARDIRVAVDNSEDTLTLAPNGIITPLARDQAKEYSIKIQKS